MRLSRSRPILALAGAGALVLSALAIPAQAEDLPVPLTATADGARITLEVLGTYESGVFDKSAAEVVAFHGRTARVFVVNAQAGVVDVLDASDPTAPVKVLSIAVSGVVDAVEDEIPEGAVANSVAVRPDGLGVIAVENDPKTDDGWLVFFDAAGDGAALGAVRVGAQPDMVAISPDGRVAVVADEGEPNDDYSIDPEGSVSVVTLPRRVAAPGQSAVATADFREFEEDGSKDLHEDVRIFAGIASSEFPVSENLEPEYVAIDRTSRTAYVALQENNAVAVVDLGSAEVTDIWPLGFKDHGLPGNGLDPSDRDGTYAEDGSSAIDIRTVDGLYGVYQPDGINSYVTRGREYLVTANEGDAREWGDYEEGARVRDLGDDGIPPLCAGSPLAGLTDDADLGRLNVTLENGLRTSGDGAPCFENLFAFGARSFSIWTTDGEQVFDSGDSMEQVTAAAVPAFFNSNHSETNLEGRSDDKGPEPENLAIGSVQGRTYAFIGLERIGGVMVYDITVPAESSFVTYVNNRDFSVAPAAAGDLGAEGVAFVPANSSPTRTPLVIVGNEVSGTTTLFEVVSLLGR